MFPYWLTPSTHHFAFSVLIVSVVLIHLHNSLFDFVLSMACLSSLPVQQVWSCVMKGSVKVLSAPTACDTRCDRSISGSGPLPGDFPRTLRCKNIVGGNKRVRLVADRAELDRARLVVGFLAVLALVQAKLFLLRGDPERSEDPDDSQQHIGAEE